MTTTRRSRKAPPGPDVPMTSVSIRAPRAYVQALRVLAAGRGVTLGDLVKEATDSAYGADLKPHLEYFAAQRGK